MLIENIFKIKNLTSLPKQQQINLLKQSGCNISYADEINHKNLVDTLAFIQSYGVTLTSKIVSWNILTQLQIKILRTLMDKGLLNFNLLEQFIREPIRNKITLNKYSQILLEEMGIKQDSITLTQAFNLFNTYLNVKTGQVNTHLLVLSLQDYLIYASYYLESCRNSLNTNYMDTRCVMGYDSYFLSKLPNYDGATRVQQPHYMTHSQLVTLSTFSPITSQDIEEISPYSTYTLLTSALAKMFDRLLQNKKLYERYNNIDVFTKFLYMELNQIPETSKISTFIQVITYNLSDESFQSFINTLYETYINHDDIYKTLSKIINPNKLNSEQLRFLDLTKNYYDLSYMFYKIPYINRLFGDTTFLRKLNYLASCGATEHVLSNFIKIEAAKYDLDKLPDNLTAHLLLSYLIDK